jgi:hypothetical protein
MRAATPVLLGATNWRLILGLSLYVLIFDKGPLSFVRLKGMPFEFMHLKGLRLIGRRCIRCAFSTPPPGKPLLTSPVARKVAAAALAAIRRRTCSKKQSSSQRYNVILLRPIAQFQAHAFGTASIDGDMQLPNGG